MRTGGGGGGGAVGGHWRASATASRGVGADLRSHCRLGADPVIRGGGRRRTLLFRELLTQRGQLVAQLVARDDAAAVSVEDLPWVGRGVGGRETRAGGRGGRRERRAGERQGRRAGGKVRRRRGGCGRAKGRCGRAGGRAVGRVGRVGRGASIVRAFPRALAPGLTRIGGEGAQHGTARHGTARLLTPPPRAAPLEARRRALPQGLPITRPLTEQGPPP